MCRLSVYLVASTSWTPKGLSRPVMGLFYLFYCSVHMSHCFVYLSHCFVYLSHCFAYLSHCFAYLSHCFVHLNLLYVFSLFVTFKILVLRCCYSFYDSLYVLLSVLCVLCFCTVSCLFSLCIQLFLLYLCTVYGPLPPGGNSTAVNKYHIISYILMWACNC
jgi:hypothetical protein